MPHRYAVAEPKLPADGPVPDVLHPVRVDLGEALGDDLDLAVDHGAVGAARDRVRIVVRPDLHEPLLADERLDDGAAALAVANGVSMGLDAVEQPQALELGDDVVAGLEAVLPSEGSALLVDRSVGVHDVDDGEAVTRADLEVRGVVARRDLERSGAEPCLDGLVGDDGNGPPDDGKHHVLADQPSEPPRRPDAPPRRCRRGRSRGASSRS